MLKWYSGWHHDRGVWIFINRKVKVCIWSIKSLKSIFFNPVGLKKLTLVLKHLQILLIQVCSKHDPQGYGSHNGQFGVSEVLFLFCLLGFLFFCLGEWYGPLAFCFWILKIVDLWRDRPKRETKTSSTYRKILFMIVHHNTEI